MLHLAVRYSVPLLKETLLKGGRVRVLSAAPFMKKIRLIIGSLLAALFAFTSIGCASKPEPKSSSVKYSFTIKDESLDLQGQNY